MTSILDIVKSDKTLSEGSLKLIESKLYVKQFPKGKVLQHQGDKLMNGYFIKTGLLRSYVIDDKGKEHTFMFAPEGWLISDLESIMSHQPSELIIDVLENSEVEIFNIAFFETIVELSPESFKKLTFLLLKRNVVLQKRVIMLMCATAATRYQHFIETYPNIVQRVSQKMIATYLGITPEVLSKIRSEFSKK